MSLGCRRDHVDLAEGKRDVIINVTSGTDGVVYLCGRTPLSLPLVEAVLKKAISTEPDLRLFLRIDKGLCVTNAMPVLEVASRCDVSRIVLRLSEAIGPYKRLPSPEL